MKARLSSLFVPGRWRDWLKVVLALVLIGIVLSKTDLQGILALKDLISWFWLASSFVLLCLMTLIKTLQYWVLLDGKVSYRETLKIVIVQNALTNFVASTAGIASYLTMFRVEQNVKLRQTGAVFIVTKAGDLLFMSLSLLLSAVLVWGRIGGLHGPVVVMLLTAAAGLLAYWTAILFRGRFVLSLQSVFSRLHLDRLPLAARALAMLESVVSKDQSALMRLLMLGGAASLAYMLFTIAFGFSRVQTFQIPLDFWAIVFIVTIMQFVSIIPFQVFGGLGVTELSLVFLYDLFGIVNMDIPAILIGLRVLFYLFNLMILLYVPVDTFLANLTLSGKPGPNR